MRSTDGDCRECKLAMTPTGSFCGNCGRAATDGSSFCAGCGQALSSTASAQATPSGPFATPPTGSALGGAPPPPPPGYGSTPGYKTPPPPPPGYVTPPAYGVPPAAPTFYAGAPVVVARRETNGLSIASLVLGIVWFLGIGSILAIIFGFVSRRQIRQSNGRQTGEGMALAGIILGFLGVLGMILWIVVFATVAHTIGEYCTNGNNGSLNRVTCTNTTFGNSGTTYPMFQIPADGSLP